MVEKRCCFAGHRYEWQSVGIENKLYKVVEGLILNGVTVFYDGGYGVFDEKARNTVLALKQKYPHIKLIKVVAYYTYEKKKAKRLSFYDEYIYPSIEDVYFKARIIKRNEWIVDNSDVVVCHIENEKNSGAYKIVKYAIKKDKRVICI